MRAFEFRSSRSLALVLAAAALASCVAHGQSSRLDPNIYLNITPYRSDFYRKLITDRAYVFEGVGRYRNVVQGQIYSAHGTVIKCGAQPRVDGNFHWQSLADLRWAVPRAGSGGYIRWELGTQIYGASFDFYDPETGRIATEIISAGSHVLIKVGQIQDTWPRALADACPSLSIPAHIRINEKQTSLHMDELRRQDPDAPIRNFRGSHLTSPGRTGLGASGGRPTTTKAEVEAFLKAQHGNVLINVKGIGLTYVRAGDREELWRIASGSMADGYWDVVRTTDEAGEWLEVREGAKVRRRYPIGYPFPYLPTGHRHPAFQITDGFLADPRPRELAFMGGAYAEKRFVFHSEDRFSVVDEAGNLVDGPHFDGVWRWTRGRLEMTVRDDPAGTRSVGWRELAADVDTPPKMWSRYSRDVGGW